MPSTSLALFLIRRIISRDGVFRFGVDHRKEFSDVLGICPIKFLGLLDTGVYSRFVVVNPIGEVGGRKVKLF